MFKFVIPSVAGVTCEAGEEEKSKHVYGAPSLALPRENFHLKPLYDSKQQLHSSAPSLEKYLDSGGFTSLHSIVKENDTNISVDADYETINWDVWEEIWEQAFDKLRVRDSAKNRGITSNNDSIVHPILIVEQEGGFTLPKGQRETMTEIMFEKFNVPAMYIMPSSVLAAFSLGRHNALVIDCGSSGCRVTPIIDGMDLKGAFRYNLRGGDWFSDQLYEKLTTKGFDILPRYKSKAQVPYSISRSFEVNAIRDLMYEFKSLHCGLYPAKIGKEETAKAAVKTHLSHTGHEHLQKFELPDGTLVNLVDEHQDLFLLPVCVNVSSYFYIDLF